MEEQARRPVASSAKRFTQEDLRETTQGSERIEADPVDLDHEMMKLSKNSVEYQFMVTMLSKKFTMLKQAIGEGV